MGNRDRSQSLLPRFVLATCSFVLTLLFLEAGFRFKAYYDDLEIDAFERVGSEPIADDPNTRVKTKNIIRLSSNPRIIYELIPGTRARYKRAVITVNERGYRGVLVPLEKSSGSVRIVGIGDSVMFGYGVGDDEYYLTLLQRQLSQVLPSTSWEVVNGAVPGYNTTMEVETLRAKFLDYSPDLIVLDYVSNDLGLPNFIRKRAPYFTLGRSYLWKYIHSRKSGLNRPPDDRLTGVPRDASEIPTVYRDMVGIDSHRRAMQKLAQLSDEHGFQVVVLCALYLPPEVRKIATTLGFPIVEAGPAMQAYLERGGRGMDEYYTSKLVVSATDPHPSPLGHELIAGVLHSYLEQSGLLTDLVTAYGAQAGG